MQHATVNAFADGTDEESSLTEFAILAPSVDDSAMLPHLPELVFSGDEQAPAAPRDVQETGVDQRTLLDLTLKLGSTVPQFTTQWAAEHLRLPLSVTSDLLEQLRVDRLLEVLGQAGRFGFRYAVAGRARDVVNRLIEISGYIGPAPVSLGAYTAMLEWQTAHFPEVQREQVTAAVSEMVLTPEELEMSGLAAAAGRSLFIFGPAGNGKTMLGRLLHNAVGGELWVPFAMVVDHSVIRIFDPQQHQQVESSIKDQWTVDQRWVRIRRPMIVAGGEMTIETCDLIYSPTLRYYEAPLHLKANGGTFFIDDFGRQRVDPYELLNRWIIPLEQQIDYLTLHTGKKIQVPFKLRLIVATNFDPMAVTDPAFLRRMGYRLLMPTPTPERYTEIFRRYAARYQAEVSPDVMEWLLARYRDHHRELRACEPRDLIERCGDICRYRKVPLQLTQDVLASAWRGYFGFEQDSTDAGIVRGKSQGLAQ